MKTISVTITILIGLSAIFYNGIEKIGTNLQNFETTSSYESERIEEVKKEPKFQSAAFSAKRGELFREQLIPIIKTVFVPIACVVFLTTFLMGLNIFKSIKTQQ